MGNDARMDGAAAAARRAGWETLQVRGMADTPQIGDAADAVLLPWPSSFSAGKLAGTEIETEQALALLPRCALLMHGAGLEAKTPQAGRSVNPLQDEGFLMANANLTAEGAIARAMQRPGRALLDATVLVAGFGRIAQALTTRLCAMGAFVIVCARSEAQMRRAHAMGAHPVPLSALNSAAAQAEVVFNTIPARVFSVEALTAIRHESLYIELASEPYGADLDHARSMGVTVALESGLPGRYAPRDAGAALFEALQRAWAQETGDERSVAQ